MSIQQEPGENVSTLVTKIHRICKRITGMVKASDIPSDLPEVCAKAFLETKTLAFNMEAVNIYKDARAGTATWDRVLTRVTNEYNNLSQGKKNQWVATRDKKEDPMIKAMQAQIKSLELQRKKDDANTTKEAGSWHANLTCRKCKKKGHIAKNCQDKKDGGATTEGASTDKDKNKDSKKTGPTSPFKIPPKDTEPKSKKINDIECAWCDRCKRWTKGEKKHLTEQHKTKAELQTPQANIAASDLPNLGGLRMSQFFH